MSDNTTCYGYWGYSNCSSAWYSWGRWVLLGIAIAAALVALVSVRWYSMVQVRRGHRAPAGTGWMVPPSYYQSQQQHQGGAAAPPYNPNIGEHDAGYYDESGNFISKPHVSPPPTRPYDEESAPYPDQAVTHNTGPDSGTDNYAPPPHPPPGHSGDGTAPTGASGAGASDYYPPPPGPPPLAAKKR